MMKKHHFISAGSLLLVFGTAMPSLALADTDDVSYPVSSPNPAPEASRFSVEGYASLYYEHFDWQPPTRRAVMDLERLAIEPSLRISDRIRADAEIEFEHGGTGVATELDTVDESGDFETDVDKGGEAEVEELNVSFLILPAVNVRVGHFLVPIGFAPVLDEPTDYFTVLRSEAESAIIPVMWDEDGVELNGAFSRVNYQLQMINGLSSAGFSSANWIAGGHQGNFETVKAEDLAVAGRLETTALPFTLLGVSGYFGNTSDNRPISDMHVPAYVTLLSGHVQFRRDWFTARALGIWGNLSNSAAVTQANQNLPNALDLPRTPVASQAYAAFAEAGVDVLAFWPRARAAQQSCVIFGRVDKYDTMLRTAGSVFDNPAMDRLAVSGGLNYNPHPHVVLKGEFTHRVLGTSTANLQNTLGASIGFTF